MSSNQQFYMAIRQSDKKVKETCPMCSSVGIDAEVRHGICERCGIEDIKHGLLEDDDDLYLVNASGAPTSPTQNMWGTPVRDSSKKVGMSFGDLYDESTKPAKSTKTLEDALEEVELR